MTEAKAAKIVDKINKKFPEAKAQLWEGSPMVGELGEIDGLPIVDYYSFDTDPHEHIYVLGIHKRLYTMLQGMGLYAEPHDPGTYCIWEA